MLGDEKGGSDHAGGISGDCRNDMTCVALFEMHLEAHRPGRPLMRSCAAADTKVPALDSGTSPTSTFPCSSGEGAHCRCCNEPLQVCLAEDSPRIRCRSRMDSKKPSRCVKRV